MLTEKPSYTVTIPTVRAVFLVFNMVSLLAQLDKTLIYCDNVAILFFQPCFMKFRLMLVPPARAVFHRLVLAQG